MRLFHNPVVRLNSLKIIEKCFNLWYNCHWIPLTKQSFTKCRWLNPSCLVYPSASTELCTRLQHKERALTGHWLPWSPLPGTMSLLFCWVWICFKYLALRYVKRSALFFKHEKRNKPSVWKEAPNRHMPYCLTVWGDQSSITPPPAQHTLIQTHNTCTTPSAQADLFIQNRSDKDIKSCLIITASLYLELCQLSAVVRVSLLTPYVFWLKRRKRGEQNPPRCSISGGRFIECIQQYHLKSYDTFHTYSSENGAAVRNLCLSRCPSYTRPLSFTHIWQKHTSPGQPATTA